VQRALVLATSVVLLVISHEWVFCFIAIGMAIRVLPTPWRFNQAADPPSIRNPSPAPAFDAPDTPNSRAMVQFVLLLFTLGVIIYLFPESQRRF
jgi:hypothetical protein